MSEEDQAGFLFKEAHFRTQSDDDPSRALDQFRFILDRYPHSIYSLEARIWIQNLLETIGESTHAEGLLIYQEMLAAEGLDIAQKFQLWFRIYDGRILAAEWAKAEEVAREALSVSLEDDCVSQSGTINGTINWVGLLSNILAIQDKVSKIADLFQHESAHPSSCHPPAQVTTEVLHDPYQSSQPWPLVSPLIESRTAEISRSSGRIIFAIPSRAAVDENTKHLRCNKGTGHFFSSNCNFFHSD